MPTEHRSAVDSFGIKPIWQSHVFPEIPYFDRPLGDGLPPLMNFKRDRKGFELASLLPIGHRCLVYVTGVQLFIWAIELTGSLQDGERARERHRVPLSAHVPFNLYRPIRFVARVDPWDRGPTRELVCRMSGVPFARMEGDSHLSLTRAQYESMYHSIAWTDQSA